MKATETVRFGDFLRAARAQAGLTQGRVARELGVSVPFVSDVEGGRRAPFSDSKLLVLAPLLRLDHVTVLAMAALDRGHVKVPILDTEGNARVAVGLAREWPHLASDDLARIASIVALSQIRRST